MKKILSTFLVGIIVQTIHAQRTMDGLIKAEKDFAAYSVANGTKDAFLKFLDSAGVIFDNGEAVNGIEASNKRKNGPGVLNWWPQFAEIANTNDFGYTTGPWTFRASAKDTIVARGQYTTVWHIDKNGEWKFLTDLGVSNLPASPMEEVRKITAPKVSIKPTTPTVYIRISPFVKLEEDFIKSFRKNKKAAYKKYLSKESILNRNGHMPAITAADQQAIIDSTSSSIQYTMTGWNLSTEQDMGYTYGTAVLNGKTENYQRIWRLEKDGWKIAVEVVRY